MHAPWHQPAAPALAALTAAAFLAAACGPATHPARPARATTSRAATPPRPASPRGAYGDLRLGFIPATHAARPVRPPLTVTLIIRPARGGTATTWATTSDPAARGLEFKLTLPPGRYRLQSLGLASPSLSQGTVTIPTGGPAFTIPAAGCAYLGMITIVLYRLPPGTPAQQGTAASKLAHGHGGYFTYLASGGLMGDTARTGTLPPPERPADARTCPSHPARF